MEFSNHKVFILYHYAFLVRNNGVFEALHIHDTFINH